MNTGSDRPKLNWGWIIGVLIGLLILAVVLVPFYCNSRDITRQPPCISHLKQLGYGMFAYSDDNNGRLPKAANWCDAIKRYVRSSNDRPVTEVFTCPALPSGKVGGYALNSALDAAKMPKTGLLVHLVMGFESDPGWNVHGGREKLPAVPRHMGGSNFVFADGHVHWLGRRDGGDLMWKP